MSARRVVVFVDYQNVYRSARRAFFNEWAAGTDGQIHPLRLGLKLKGAGGDRELLGVRVYRGQPGVNRPGVAAASRQIGLWTNQSLVTPITRTINYRDPDNPREKGIDVALAIDFVMMAHRDEYDIGILFSEDTDLLPALEAVAEMRGPEACETATWVPESGKQPRPLLLPLQRLGAVHLLSKQDYDHVRDDTDYNVKRRRR